MPGYQFYTCDVFTERRFGGNQLAVVPHADGLSDAQMQQIAREFNYSESTFVFPAKEGHTRRVRIFTPASEVPFAGHPNVGTAFVLASIGELGPLAREQTVIFEEKAGLVSVAITVEEGRVTSCEVTAPQPLSLGAVVPVAEVAAALSLDKADIVTTTHPPQVASVGLPFVVTELRDRAALERARINMSGLYAVARHDVRPFMYIYAHADDGVDIRARMFAPTGGVPEDPATGSATCAVAGLMAHCHADRSGTFQWRLAQGVEMGRPSALIARAVKEDGRVRSTHVAGPCVMVCEGHIEV